MKTTRSSGSLVRLIGVALVLVLSACSKGMADGHTTAGRGGTRAAPPPAAGRAVAMFAGGCFWCMETAFEGLPGVDAVLSGYAGGHVRSPSYEEVSSGTTGHAESVRVIYDPHRITYAHLLDIYWHNIDPLDAGGQFCDRGNQYRSAIFPVDAAQKREAERSKRAIEQKLGHAVATRIEHTDAFWIAEDYHQDFYRKNPVRYHSYRLGCGRDARLEQLWGHPGRSL